MLSLCAGGCDCADTLAFQSTSAAATRRRSMCRYLDDAAVVLLTGSEKITRPLASS
jgi:hypothetical protein